MHPRKIIRGAAVSVLATGTGDPLVYPTDAGARVFDSRDLPLGENTPPTILVYTNAEEIDRDQFHEGGPRRRILTMMVECYAVGAEDAADTVDTLAWQAENALRADPTLGNLVERCEYINSAIAFDDSAEVALWAAGMSFEVVYWTHDIADEGEPPQIVMVGYDPLTGPGNEPLYSEVTDDSEVL